MAYAGDSLFMPIANSEYDQSDFSGGMNLLGDDTKLGPTQYRVGFNLTNRFNRLDLVLESQVDPAIPAGLKQEIVTFGNYIIVFIAGSAFYRYYTSEGWTPIVGFRMSPDAVRYWTCAIPVSTTNYARVAATSTVPTVTAAAPNGGINLISLENASAGNLPGLLVQDGVNQPMFIYVDAATLLPVSRTTQTFDQWSITYTDATNTVVADNKDQREYVPIGQSMTWDDGILYVTAPDGNNILRSVSGRPLDFMVNVSNTLVTVDPFTQVGGGDAYSTAYSVGVGGIVCLRAMSSGGIFVAASNSNFAVTKNMTQNAPTEFGEYTFIRTFLFNATCLSDRSIFDSLGDTRFIDLTGVRSFNAIEQTQNEGRNTPFTLQVQDAFTGVVQDANFAAGILYDNYELYAMQTIFGPALAKYDSINQCWTSFDVTLTGGKRIKILAKIELSIQRLYAITEDDQLYTLYIGPNLAKGVVRTAGISANAIAEDNEDVKLNDPKMEIKPINARVVLNNLTDDCLLTYTPYVNNRLTLAKTMEKVITYSAPTIVSTDPFRLPDVNTLLANTFFQTPNVSQGWKMFGVFEWNSGSITQFSFEAMTLTPNNPVSSQGTTL